MCLPLFRFRPIAAVLLSMGVVVDSKNTEKLSAQTVMDAGLRYETRINANPVAARLYVSNFTNKPYWNSSGCLGEPRTIAFSLTTKF